MSSAHTYPVNRCEESRVGQHSRLPEAVLSVLRNTPSVVDLRLQSPVEFVAESPAHSRTDERTVHAERRPEYRADDEATESPDAGRKLVVTVTAVGPDVSILGRVHTTHFSLYSQYKLRLRYRVEGVHDEEEEYQNVRLESDDRRCEPATDSDEMAQQPAERSSRAPTEPTEDYQPNRESPRFGPVPDRRDPVADRDAHLPRRSP